MNMTNGDYCTEGRLGVPPKTGCLSVDGLGRIKHNFRYHFCLKKSFLKNNIYFRNTFLFFLKNANTKRQKYIK